jgi:hypothetical protein
MLRAGTLKLQIVQIVWFCAIHWSTDNYNRLIFSVIVVMKCAGLGFGLALSCFLQMFRSLRQHGLYSSAVFAMLSVFILFTPSCFSQFDKTETQLVRLNGVGLQGCNVMCELVVWPPHGGSIYEI